jgi:hypothetical protein
MAEQWIPSDDAIRLVAQRYDASEQYAEWDISLAVAEDALLKRLSCGALRARAAKGQMHHGNPFAMENESHFENECLPVAFWCALSQSHDQERELDWVLGDFSYSTGHSEHITSGSAFDVQFDAKGIPGASHLAEAVSVPTSDKSGPGRPARYDWPKTVLAIFGLIYRGDLKPGNQAEIERAIIDHLSDENGGPSQSTVRPFAKLVWEECNRG